MVDGMIIFFWTSIPPIRQTISYYWTSMPIISQTIPIIGPQCSLLGATFAKEHILGTCSWKNEHGHFTLFSYYCHIKACYWTSMCFHAPFLVQHLRKNTFWELVPGKMDMGILELSSKQALFSKWLRRPNHYAHETRIEILCKTPVSILRDLSPGLQNHW